MASNMSGVKQTSYGNKSNRTTRPLNLDKKVGNVKSGPILPGAKRKKKM